MGIGKTTKRKDASTGAIKKTRTGVLPSGAKYQVSQRTFPGGASFTTSKASKDSPGKSHLSVRKESQSHPLLSTKKQTTAKKTVRKMGAKAVSTFESNAKGEGFHSSTVSKGRKAKTYQASDHQGGRTSVSYPASSGQKQKAMTAVKRMDFNQAKKGK